MTRPRPLHHITSRRRVRQWKKGKNRSLVTAAAYREIAKTAPDGDKLVRLSDRMGACAMRLDFVKDEHAQLTLANSYRCHCRMCPLCMAAAARAAYAILAARVKVHAELYPRSLPALLTLTVPNVTGDQLTSTLSDMTAAFRKMRKMRAFETAVLGWRRSTEVTYNPDTKTFHPHFHVLLMLSELYWLPGYYLAKLEWQAMWQKAIRLPTAIVDIRRKGRDKDGVLILSDDDSLAECAKYVVKPMGVFEATPEGHQIEQQVLHALHYGLRSKRLYDYGGTLKKVPKPDRPKPFDGDLERLSYLWSEILDPDDNIHEADFWPLDAVQAFGPLSERSVHPDHPPGMRAREPPEPTDSSE